MRTLKFKGNDTFILDEWFKKIFETKRGCTAFFIDGLKVANIILDGRFGGPQNLILQVAERLKKYEIEMIVIIPKKDSKFFYSKLVEKNICVKRLNLHRLTKYKPHLIGWFLFFIPELFFLYRYLKRERIKLVHCNTSWQIKGILAGKIAGAKIIWHLQDTWTPKGIKMLFHLLASLCDGFIVAGNRVKQYYLNSKVLKAKKIIEIQAPIGTSYSNPNSLTYGLSQMEEIRWEKFLEWVEKRMEANVFSADKHGKT